MSNDLVERLRHVPSVLQTEAAEEIERLGRCNEQINKTMSEIITRQNFEIERLKAENERLKCSVHVESCSVDSPHGFQTDQQSSTREGS